MTPEGLGSTAKLSSSEEARAIWAVSDRMIAEAGRLNDAAKQLTEEAAALHRLAAAVADGRSVEGALRL